MGQKEKISSPQGKKSIWIWSVFIIIFSIVIMLFLIEPPRDMEINDLPLHLQRWGERGKMMLINGHSMYVNIFDAHSSKKGEKESASSHSSSTLTYVLIHGFPSSSYEFHRVAEQLSRAKKAKVIVYDHLGFGFSDKPKTEYPFSLMDQAEQSLALWRALNITSAHFVAHDMGDTILTEVLGRWHRGMLPAYFEKNNSNNNFFQSVTFTNGGMIRALINMRISQQILIMPYVGSVFQQVIHRLDRSGVFSKLQLKSIWSPSYANAAQMHQDIEDMLCLLRLHGGHKLLVKLIRYLTERGEYEHRWLPALGNASASWSCRFIWGDSDAVAPVAIAREIVGKISHGRCTLRTLRDVGHFIQLENPQIWVSAVSEATDG